MPCVTESDAVAPFNPCDETVMVPVPAVAAVNWLRTTPDTGVIGVSIDDGLNEPVTPLIENVIGFVAVPLQPVGVGGDHRLFTRVALQRQPPAGDRQVQGLRRHHPAMPAGER